MTPISAGWRRWSRPAGRRRKFLAGGLTRGGWGGGRRPAFPCWMVRPEPQARTRATASPGPGTGSGRSSTLNGTPGALRTSALMGALLRGGAPSLAEHEVRRLQQERPVGAVRVQEGRRVAHELLDADLLHVAVAPVDLQAPGGDLPGRLRRHDLGQGPERSVPALVLMVGQPARPVDVRARGGDEHAHL